MAHLDHNAAGPLHPAAADAVREALLAELGHPDARHGPGRAAARRVHAAREAVGALLGVPASWVVLTSGATEANVTAVHAAVSRLREAQGAGRLVVGATEHPSVTAAARQVAARAGVELVEVPVDGAGRHALPALREGDALFLLAAQPETGVVTDLQAVADAVAGAGARWHVDAVQFVGRVPARFGEGPLRAADSASVSGHKLGAPTGVGALVTRRLHTPLLPGSRPETARAGAPGLLAVVGLTAVAPYVLRRTTDDTWPRVTALRDALEAELRARGGVAHGAGAPRLPQTTLVSLRGPGGWVDGLAVVERLAVRGVHVGTGSACLTGRPSPALTAMGVSPEVAAAAVRFSLGPESTEDDVQHALVALDEVLGGA